MKLRHSGVWVQSGNAHAIDSSWGVAHTNECSDRCSLTASQDEDQRARHIKGVYGYGDFNHPDICWSDNTAQHTQSRKFLQVTEDNFLIQVVEEPTRKDQYIPMSKKSGKMGQETCVDEQGGSSKTQAEERNLWVVDKVQAVWEDYRNIIMACRDATRKAKAHLEFSLTTSIKDSKKGFYKYISSKRKTKENVGPLLNQMGVLVMEVTDNMELLITFFVSVFIAEAGPQVSQTLEADESGRMLTNPEPLGEFELPLCQRDNTAGHKQSQRFFEYVSDNFLIQMIKEKTRRGAMLDVVLTSEEKLAGNVVRQDSVGCSDHKMEREILKAVRRSRSKMTALNFRRADFGPFKDLLGRIP
ncbi:hypothetical protein WISP_93575 [Willisornis vidua]|uniref:Uncharacterized protein n=1 Tax=Willisornis vidua TaxID=1566151 RepID=A0ABQ9D0W5_9PASS|nr:hypothetical protein WISP_93575 [Willisornis vidua]